MDRIHTSRGHRNSRGMRTASRAETSIAVIALAGLLVAAALSARPVPAPSTTTAIRVQHGDTLWGIAKQNPIKGLTTAQTADIIADLNRLDGAALQPGDELQVPGAPLDRVALAMR